ncbi:MAG: VWA domain-containing protein [Blastocatellia bacterium]
MLMFLLALSALVVMAQPAKQKPPPQQPQKDAQEPGIVVPTILVTVPVVVTDGFGNFVTGLKKEDFMVREDGRQQEIQELYDEEKAFSVALLIDTSRSTKQSLGDIRKAAQAFIKQLQPRDRVMIVTFDEQIRFINDFTNDVKELDKAIKTISSSYLTSMYDAIHRTVNEKLAQQPGRKAIVLLTDGVDTNSKTGTFENTLDLISSRGIVCYAIQYETRNQGSPLVRPLFFPGPGNFLPRGSSLMPRGFAPAYREDQETQQEEKKQEQQEPPKSKSIINLPRTTDPASTAPRASTAPPDQEPRRSSRQIIYLDPKNTRDRYQLAGAFLSQLALRTGARHMRAENLGNTSFAFATIAAELRHQYTLTYQPTNIARDGSYRTIVVNVGNRNLVVRARPGYDAPRQ